MVRQRARIRFQKRGDLRLIGHRDLGRCMERLFRRAGLRLGMSQGFHPRPRISFPSALAVGIEGLDEVMEVELAEAYPPDEIHRRLASQAIPGVAFRSVEILPPGARKAQLSAATYEVEVPPARRGEAAKRIARLMAASSWPILRPGRRGEIDLRPFLKGLALAEGVLTMRLRASRGQSAGPRDVLCALGLDDLERTGIHVARTAVEVQP